MKKGQIFAIISAVIVLIILGAIIYVFTNLNRIVKAAIEEYGSQATKTEVRVSSVNIELSQGEASISGLTVGNPPGFSTPDIFKLGNILTRIDVKSVTKSPIVIDAIRIAGPQVFYEMNKSGSSNLEAIKKNLEGPPQKKPAEKKAKKEIKLFIRKLVIENGRVEARAALLGGKTVTLDLPRIELTDIGKNGGATPDQVTKAVLSALVQETTKAVQRQGEKAVKKGAEGMLKRYLGK